MGFASRLKHLGPSMGAGRNHARLYLLRGAIDTSRAWRRSREGLTNPSNYVNIPPDVAPTETKRAIPPGIATRSGRSLGGGTVKRLGDRNEARDSVDPVRARSDMQPRCCREAVGFHSKDAR